MAWTWWLQSNQALINKKGTSTIEIKRLQVSVTEIFKTRNEIDPSYMQNILIAKPNNKFCPNDIEVRYHKTTSYNDEG